MKPLLLAIALLLAPVATPVSAVAQTVERRVEAAKAAGSIPAPDTISGLATWYSWHPGEAAAGPALRRWLGSGWRGQTVRVCGLSNCITTKLTDWCLCGHGRIIDLDRRAFSRLADPSVGILRVTVMPRLGGYAIPHVTVPRPTAPATDTSEDQP